MPKIPVAIVLNTFCIGGAELLVSQFIEFEKRVIINLIIMLSNYGLQTVLKAKNLEQDFPGFQKLYLSTLKQDQ